MKNDQSFFIILLLSTAFVIVVFLAIRVLVLWYWKIDTIVSNQQKQIDLLTMLLSQSRANSTGSLTAEQKAKTYDERNK